MLLIITFSEKKQRERETYTESIGLLPLKILSLVRMRDPSILGSENSMPSAAKRG